MAKCGVAPRNLFPKCICGRHNLKDKNQSYSCITTVHWVIHNPCRVSSCGQNISWRHAIGACKLLFDLGSQSRDGFAKPMASAFWASAINVPKDKIFSCCGQLLRQQCTVFSSSCDVYFWCVTSCLLLFLLDSTCHGFQFTFPPLEGMLGSAVVLLQVLAAVPV